MVVQYQTGQTIPVICGRLMGDQLTKSHFFVSSFRWNFHQLLCSYLGRVIQGATAKECALHSWSSDFGGGSAMVGDFRFLVLCNFRVSLGPWLTAKQQQFQYQQPQWHSDHGSQVTPFSFPLLVLGDSVFQQLLISLFLQLF